MSRRVFALGETLIDILFENNQPFKAVPGGSMLNAAVSLGRMGVEIQLLSEFGSDHSGKLVCDFLQENHVGYEWSHRYDSNRTSLALAFLDKDRNAEYSFYHDTPGDIPGYRLPRFSDKDILLFGSFYSIKPERVEQVQAVIRSARNSSVTILFDPNIRKGHLDDLGSLKSTLYDNFKNASLVKGSEEDFFHIFGTLDPENVYDQLKPLCPYLFITRGNKDLVLMTPSYKATYPVTGIEPVSTVGAGDNFNAGIIYALVKNGVTGLATGSIEPTTWDEIAAYGIEFATAACLSFENYVPADFNPSGLTNN